MALVRIACSECGDVELWSRDLEVRICFDTGRSTYLFRCPVCRMIEVNPGDEQIVDILVAAGVRCIEWRLPAELGERPAGKPLTYADVLDFHELLQDDTWLATLGTVSKPASMLNVAAPTTVAFDSFSPQQVWQMFFRAE